MRVLRFGSFGVGFEVEVLDEQLASKILERLKLVFGNLLQEGFSSADPIRFRIENGGSDEVRVTDRQIGTVDTFSSSEFVELFESLIRIRVAEHAPDHVFVHAGVVAINGEALVLPGRSRAGKSTLVSELVKAGCVYYSDEYAVLDTEANVLPFAKPLSMRIGAGGTQTDVDARSLGVIGTKPISCGMVLLTEYEETSELSLERLSAASGVLKILEHTVPVRRNPHFSLKVLNKLALRAIITQSYRAEAEEVAINLINYFNREVINVPQVR